MFVLFVKIKESFERWISHVLKFGKLLNTSTSANLRHLNLRHWFEWWAYIFVELLEMLLKWLMEARWYGALSAAKPRNPSSSILILLLPQLLTSHDISPNGWEHPSTCASTHCEWSSRRKVYHCVQLLRHLRTHEKGRSLHLMLGLHEGIILRGL
jgi:hypothetical protein